MLADRKTGLQPLDPTLVIFQAPIAAIDFGTAPTGKWGSSLGQNHGRKGHLDCLITSFDASWEETSPVKSRKQQQYETQREDASYMLSKQHV